MTARVLVLGSPGSDKSTLARELAARSGLPLSHLDDEYWRRNWSRPDPAWWQRRQLEIAATERSR
jgi:adenylate kinase family enzyme